MTAAPTVDSSGGWDAVADRFMAERSRAGVDVVRRWAARLPAGGEIVDIGCGSGVPIAEALINDGFGVSGVDASPTLISAFRRRFPAAPVACEPAEESLLFGRTFDGAIAIGLLFLLAPADQRQTLRRTASALRPSGRLLFSAPRRACEWKDVLTGRPSVSLGLEAYERILAEVGMQLRGAEVDEGTSHYLDAVKVGV